MGFRPMAGLKDMTDIPRIVLNGVGFGLGEFHDMIIEMPDMNRVRLAIEGQRQGQGEKQQEY